PSATIAPASVRPVQVTAALPPLPARVVTAAPIVEPLTGAALNVQPLAPLAPSVTLIVSRIPSPLGEMRVPLIEAEVTVGATVSIVTPYIARALTRNAAAGL